MKPFTTTFFISILMLFIHVSCDLGLDIRDPYADRGVFELTVTNYFSEVRRIGGRDIIVTIMEDTTYRGNDAVFTHANGIIDVWISNDEDSVMARIIGGAEGTALLGEYPINEYDENSPVQSNIFYGMAETKLLGDTFTFFSENGLISIAMYSPNHRFRAIFYYRARVVSDIDDLDAPDSVRIDGSFNALIEK
jgi:hypothetical protein